MISRPALKALIGAGLIKVTPDPVNIGPNSIDLRLGSTLKTYHPSEGRVVVRDPVNGATYHAIDPRNPPPLIDVPKVRDVADQWPNPKGWDRDGFEDCWILVPGQFYLGATLEETYCRGVVPHLDGRSTCGRLSIEAHKTAGVGDNGFQGRWTLEIEVTEPVLIGPGDRLFQMYFTPAWGEGLAMVIRSLADGTACWQSKDDPNWIEQGPIRPDGEPTASGPLVELHDLYGIGHNGHHHYQGSKEIRGAAPLD